MKSELSPFTVYTIRRAQDLDRCAKRGTGEFTEHKRWVGALGLLDQAKRAGTRLPIIFADAGNTTDTLMYYGFISNLDVSRNTTTYRFTELRPIGSKRQKSSLVLRSTGKALSDDFIRNLAYVHTPAYIRA